MFLSQDRRNLTPRLIVKEIHQNTNGLWPLYHPEPVIKAAVKKRCTCFDGNNLFAAVDSEAERGYEEKVWCPLRSAHSSAYIFTGEKEQLKGNK